VKSALKGTHIRSVDEVKSKMADMLIRLNRVSADDLKHCAQQWGIRMQLCTLKGTEN
jgi:hypothetical protein